MENFPGMNPDFSSLAETSDDKPEKKKSKEKKSKKPASPEQAPKPEVKKDETNEKSENDNSVPLESLAKDEKKLVAAGYIEVRSSEILDELQVAEPESSDEGETLANAIFLENLKSKISESDSYDGSELDDVLSDTIESLSIESSTLDTEDRDDKSEDEDSSSLSSGSSDGRPPTPPTDNSGDVLPPNRSPGNNSPSVSYNQNINPNTSSTQNSTYEQRPAGSYMLVGGIIGYMIGRRGGRIRTEKKLIPIQKKLESQIIDLQHEIALREEKIRKVVREQQANRPKTNEILINKLHESRKKQETKDKSFAKERIGKILVSSNIQEISGHRVRNVESLNLPELLNIAETIYFENTNIRKLYESNRITHENLTRIIKAYINGDNFEKYIGNLTNSYESEPSAGYSDKESVSYSNNFTPEFQQNISNFHQPEVKASHNTADISQTENSKQAKKHMTQSKAVWITIAILFAVFAGMLILSS